jgi:hypothetical protein
LRCVVLEQPLSHYISPHIPGLVTT